MQRPSHLTDPVNPCECSPYGIKENTQGGELRSETESLHTHSSRPSAARAYIHTVSQAVSGYVAERRSALLARRARWLPRALSAPACLPNFNHSVILYIGHSVI